MSTRSVRATVAAGFRLYMSNFHRIIKLTWLPALICAVVSMLYNHFSIQSMPLLLGGQRIISGQGLAEYMMLSGISLLNFIVSLIFISYGFSMLSRHRTEGAIPHPAGWFTRPDLRMLMRTAASAIVCIVVVGLALGVTIGIIVAGAVMQSVTTMALGSVLLVIALILLLPLVYPLMYYVTTRDSRLFSILGSGYRQGLRRWGYIFAVLFVTFIAVLSAFLITTLPAIILIIANMKAQAGTLMGDALGMPSYMTWLSLLVFLLAGFVECYIILLLYFPAYYMTLKD